MSWFYKKKNGFTLLELMIVVIIIGILATLALPRFLAAAARARWAAAASTLGIIRNAQMRYYARFDVFSNNMNHTGMDINLPNTPQWTINNPAGGGPGAVVGSVTNVGTGQIYTITDAGVFNIPEP